MRKCKEYDGDVRAGGSWAAGRGGGALGQRPQPSGESNLGAAWRGRDTSRFGWRHDAWTAITVTISAKKYRASFQMGELSRRFPAIVISPEVHLPVLRVLSTPGGLRIPCLNQEVGVHTVPVTEGWRQPLPVPELRTP